MFKVQVEDIAKLIQNGYKVDVSHHDVKLGNRITTVNYLTLINKERGQAILISTNDILDTATILYSEQVAVMEVTQEFMTAEALRAFCDVVVDGGEEATICTTLRASNLAEIIKLNKNNPVANRR